MIRSSPLIAALFLAACSSPTSVPQAQSTVVAVPTPAASTADARAARAVAQRYFDLLRSGDAAGAHGLWSDGTGGSVQEFVAAQRRYVRYDGKASTPSVVKTTDGQDYILVEAEVLVTPRAGKPVKTYGTVMLRRPTRTGAGAGQPWRIWGLDIRPRHCKPGERPRGLSCVKQ